MKHYLKLMRVHHYIKNLLVFAALACSGQLFNLEKLAAGTAAFIAFCMASSNVFYALWSMDEKTISFYNNEYLIFTVPIVLLITMKYSLDIEGESDGDPVEVLLHDKVLLTLCILYLAIMFAILYL